MTVDENTRAISISRLDVPERLLGMDTTKADSPHPRNPFGVIDAPDPNGSDVDDFAAQAHWIAGAGDPNACAWTDSGGDEQRPSIEGVWSSRWNGGADPTLVGDTEATWKRGKAELRTVGDRVYVLFDWADGARHALIDARRDGPARLIGRYVNVSDPTTTCPWVGLIVDNRRIDGRWAHGRLDFNR
jgi:hypothetical protein